MRQPITLRFELVFTRRTLRILIASLLVSVMAPELGSESVTLTTYYPAPSGVYTKMITTADAFLARDGGRVGIGVTSPSTRLEVAQNEAIKVGQAYLSSGGDYVHLANNEWYNGSAWQRTANGALIQLTGQNINFYRQTGGAHSLSAQIDSSGNILGQAVVSGSILTTIGGWPSGHTTGSGYVHVSAAGCSAVVASGGAPCAAGSYATFSPGLYTEGTSYQNRGGAVHADDQFAASVTQVWVMQSNGNAGWGTLHKDDASTQIFCCVK